MYRKMEENGFSSLEDLSLEIGINKGTISKYFRGVQRPSIDVIPLFCEALNVSPEELLTALGVTNHRE